METIRLTRGEWHYNSKSPLGPPGGFGEVFAGEDTNGNPVAVKRLHLTADEAAHRELDIAKELINSEYEYVIPVLDYGQDAESDRYFIVMPRAERSLQALLDDEITLNESDTVDILSQIVQGLIETSDIVHRDLKPGNILFHDGRWKITDFGIARFVEESTSLRTLKGYISDPYAAPEQWRFEHATKATDIYTLGCIAHALLDGSPPFVGPRREDFREQHLNESPPTIPGITGTLSSLISMSLRKVPEGRPSLSRIRNILDQISASSHSDSSGSGLSELEKAGAAAAQREAERESQRQKAQSEAESRGRIAKQGYEILEDISDQLLRSIMDVTPSAKRPNQKRVNIDNASIEIHPRYFGEVIGENAFRSTRWDVVGSGLIVVVQDNPEYHWSASLWYMDRNHRRGSIGNYRWYEIMYMDSPLASRQHEFAPFALGKDLQDADLASAPTMQIYQEAWGPVTMDDEDESPFIDRWAKVFARASQGRLQYPSTLPLRNNFFEQL